MTTPEPRFLRISQVATQLCVSPDTVERMVNDGRLDHVRVGRFKIIPIEALEAFIKANHHPASA